MSLRGPKWSKKTFTHMRLQLLYEKYPLVQEATEKVFPVFALTVGCPPDNPLLMDPVATRTFMDGCKEYFEITQFLDVRAMYIVYCNWYATQEKEDGDTRRTE